MRINKPFLYASVAGVLAGLMVAGANAQTAALSGQVSSAEEGAMEGVLVSAKKDGSTITTTVVTNDKGQFSFPADRLEPGHYTITIRAAGYNLVGPKEVDVAGGAAATADLKLAKTKNVQAQLSNAEWLLSAPGNDQIKSFLPDCVGCHTLQRVFSSIHTPDEWKQVFARMGRYAPESVPTRPQLLLAGGPRSERPRVPADLMDAAAEFLVNANVSNPDSEEFNFKRLPRPKGRATHVIITEYDLPRKEALPHDVIVDADGHAWYSDFGNQFVGELDPKTGKVTDYALETLRQDQPKGPLGLELDPDGNIWIGMSYQAGASKIDRKTKEVTTYPLPKEWQGHHQPDQHGDADPHECRRQGVDGTTPRTAGVFRLDLKSGKWEDRGVATTAKGETIRGYGLPSDKDNNVYLMSFGDTRIGKLDAKTNVAQIWSTAFARSRPRRGRFDDQNRLWFAEYAGEPHRHVRSHDRADQGMEAADDMERALRRRPGQGRRRSVDRLDADRPGRRASIRRPTRSSNICCRTRPTSGASSSRRPDRARCCGSATTTAAPSSRSSRSTERVVRSRRQRLPFRESTFVIAGLVPAISITCSRRGPRTSQRKALQRACGLEGAASTDNKVIREATMEMKHAWTRREVLSMVSGASAAGLAAMVLPAQAQVTVPWSTGTALAKTKAPPNATDCHHHIYSSRFKVDPNSSAAAGRCLGRRLSPAAEADRHLAQRHRAAFDLRRLQ